MRHRGKIEAAVKGAQAWIALEEKQGFDQFIWDYVNGKPLVNTFEKQDQVPPYSDLSVRISNDLKKESNDVFTFIIDKSFCLLSFEIPWEPKAAFYGF